MKRALTVLVIIASSFAAGQESQQPRDKSREVKGQIIVMVNKVGQVSSNFSCKADAVVKHEANRFSVEFTGPDDAKIYRSELKSVEVHPVYTRYSFCH